jgi:hypothetical protein
MEGRHLSIINYIHIRAPLNQHINHLFFFIILFSNYIHIRAPLN